jgi:hypothetical protein
VAFQAGLDIVRQLMLEEVGQQTHDVAALMHGHSSGWRPRRPGSVNRVGTLVAPLAAAFQIQQCQARRAL